VHFFQGHQHRRLFCTLYTCPGNGAQPILVLLVVSISNISKEGFAERKKNIYRKVRQHHFKDHTQSQLALSLLESSCLSSNALLYNPTMRLSNTINHSTNSIRLHVIEGQISIHSSIVNPPSLALPIPFCTVRREGDLHEF
jgi:hypothetical protein